MNIKIRRLMKTIIVIIIGIWIVAAFVIIHEASSDERPPDALAMAACITWALIFISGLIAFLYKYVGIWEDIAMMRGDK